MFKNLFGSIWAAEVVLKMFFDKLQINIPQLSIGAGPLEFNDKFT